MEEVEGHDLSKRQGTPRCGEKEPCTQESGRPTEGCTPPCTADHPEMQTVTPGPNSFDLTVLIRLLFNLPVSATLTNDTRSTVPSAEVLSSMYATQIWQPVRLADWRIMYKRQVGAAVQRAMHWHRLAVLPDDAPDAAWIPPDIPHIIHTHCRPEYPEKPL